MEYAIPVFTNISISKNGSHNGLVHPNLVIFSFAPQAHSGGFPRGQIMDERRHGGRYIVSLPIRVKWKDENGKQQVEDGLTENVGPQGALIYLPRNLPTVGSKVNLTVNENPSDPISVTAQVIRLERNAAHPQAALQLTDSLRLWKKKVFDYAAAMVAAERPDDLDEW
jgi:hypothetical protein